MTLFSAWKGRTKARKRSEEASEGIWKKNRTQAGPVCHLTSQWSGRLRAAHVVAAHRRVRFLDMSAAHPGFRIFILGAGFSRHAGLPLGSELFAAVRRKIENGWGRETKFQRDLSNYIEYVKGADGINLNEDSVDLEALLSYLDIEHYLQLRGSDTWSDEGNESQLMIRRAIGEVIYEATPSADDLIQFYIIKSVFIVKIQF